jgi:hypothetical protein
MVWFGPTLHGLVWPNSTWFGLAELSIVWFCRTQHGLVWPNSTWFGLAKLNMVGFGQITAKKERRQMIISASVVEPEPQGVASLIRSWSRMAMRLRLQRIRLRQWY